MTAINQIWTIANEVRGAVDGWDFKHFVLGTLCYRYLSEDFTDYMQGVIPTNNYTGMSDETFSDEEIDSAITAKGYFIYPSQLFANVAFNAANNDRLGSDLADILESIENSASGYPSEMHFKGLFAEFNVNSGRLGNSTEDRNLRLALVLRGISDLKFQDGCTHEQYGDVCDVLINSYAANSGIAGAQLQTPSGVSQLLVQLATHKQTTINKIYDPAAGSGSLLLKVTNPPNMFQIENGIYGQEINRSTYIIARMNMLMHGIPYNRFNIAHGNTLVDPQFRNDSKCDAIVSNPPYSTKWIGDENMSLIQDQRYAPAGILAPKSKADLAFILHSLDYLSNKGRAAIVCHPAVLYRPGAECKIRRYLIENNYVEAVIALPPHVIYGTPTGMNILVLSKNKTDERIQFIDASSLFGSEAVKEMNVITDGHIAQIVGAFDHKVDFEGLSVSVGNAIVAAKEFSLSVGDYLVSNAASSASIVVH